MKRIKHILLAGLPVMLLLSSCMLDETLRDGGSDAAVVNLSVRADGLAINEDTELWEDRVTEIRMLMFDSSGKAIQNRMLDFPFGFEMPCEAIEIMPGTYDFYFIANESAYSGAFTTALATITSVTQFQGAAFRNLEYRPDFVPDGTSGEGRFLMSAVYTGVVVNKGGTRQQPVQLALPTESVELVRALAKVNLTFRKKVSGGAVPEGAVDSVQLQSVTRNFSVPPLNVAPRTPLLLSSNTIIPEGFDYSRDSIGSVVFYIPELLRLTPSLQNTSIHINDRYYALESDPGLIGLVAQRRNIQRLSKYSVIRNYEYRVNVNINSEGGIELETSVVPWVKAPYIYMFQDPDLTLVVPPVEDTPGGIIIPTDCGKIELLSTNEKLPGGLQGAYGDQILWWDPVTQGPRVVPGNPPYYCEQKYGPGWRLINSCELMSFLALFDQAYRVWQSNTWQGINSKLPFYPAAFRQQAQDLLQKLSGQDLSMYTPSDSGVDPFGTMKLGIIDMYFTPGDVMPTLNEYPGGWPYPSPPETGIEPWFPMETILQFKGYWYSGYLEYSNPANHDKILYEKFTRYSFSSTTSRCVRSVE